MKTKHSESGLIDPVNCMSTRIVNYLQDRFIEGNTPKISTWKEHDIIKTVQRNGLFSVFCNSRERGKLIHVT